MRKKISISQKDRREEFKKRVSVIYDLLSSFYGADKLILKAAKFDSLTLLRSRGVEKKVLGLQKIFYEDPTLEKVPSLKEIPDILEQLEDKMAEIFALQKVHNSIEQKVNKKLQERHEQYLLELKSQLLKEEGGPENPQTLKKYALLERMYSKGLSHSAMEFLRPASLEEVIGQERGIKALMSKLASPFPQHMIIYGPPGVGKTAAARLALEAARKMPYTPFSEDAPFVEVDATTLRWDPRGITNPLIGSVHDPIYQGARRDLSEGGIPEPKPGLVTEAHAGVLFIDEIGEMDLHLQSKLLKVLEDKKVFFESAYYDPSDPLVPKYIRNYFDYGAPADFILIGATTRTPGQVSSALRSRCSAVYFEPLTSEDIKIIVKNAAQKLKVDITAEAIALISRYTSEGRGAIRILADAFGLALYNTEGENYTTSNQNGKENERKKPLKITKELVKEVILSNRLSPVGLEVVDKKPQIGKVHGLAATGYLGEVLEIEAVSFPASQPGKGTIRFNETAGSMARDSAFNAASVIRKITGLDLGEFDLHINVVGGANINGPSAGTALFLALYSTLLQKPIRQDIAVSGELSLQGEIKPVGGLIEKLYGARMSGISTVFLPRKNKHDLPLGMQDVEIIFVDSVKDLLSQALVEGIGNGK
ncbi:MAG: Lon family ATP-dependent protease [Dethiobacteria bacterium]|jgi:ATP-dependent Lon protease